MVRNIIVIFLLILSTVPVFAQTDESVLQKVASISELIVKADNLLQVSTVFPLAGLAITAASFLFHISKDDENKIHLIYAKKNFINAFYVLIICGVLIFVFDFLEIPNGKFFEYFSLLDVLVTFGLFGYSLFFIIRGANGLKNSIQ